MQGPVSPRTKRNLGLFVFLYLFGGMCIAASDEVRHRPAWAQYGIIAFWTVIALVILDALIRSAEERQDEERTERLNELFEEYLSGEGEPPIAP